MQLRGWVVLAGLGAPAAWAQMPPALTAAVQAHAEKAGVRQLVNVRHALADLDADGRDDALVFLTDPDWCSVAGCTLLVFRGGKERFALVSDSRAIETPIRVTPERSQGWKTLIVHAKGRGDVLMRFGGKRYPADAAALPMASAAQRRRAAAVID
jgi:hypothetical protein